MSNRPNRSRGTGGGATSPDRKRALLIAGAVGLLVVVVGLVVALAGGTDDDTTATTGDVPAFGPVIVEDTPLPAFASTENDAAVGQVSPLLEGIAPDGSPVSVGGVSGSDGDQPTLVAFLAHWCPHCQRELPLLVDLIDGGDLDGIRPVAVLTGTSAQRPNFPPAAWLDREGWTNDILLDDEASTAAQAFGLTSYPYLVFLDGTGKVVARASGEVSAADILAMADQAR